jgi:hypothetical protein
MTVRGHNDPNPLNHGAYLLLEVNDYENQIRLLGKQRKSIDTTRWKTYQETYERLLSNEGYEAASALPRPTPFLFMPSKFQGGFNELFFKGIVLSFYTHLPWLLQITDPEAYCDLMNAVESMYERSRNVTVREARIRINCPFFGQLKTAIKEGKSPVKLYAEGGYDWGQFPTGAEKKTRSKTTFGNLEIESVARDPFKRISMGLLEIALQDVA